MVTHVHCRRWCHMCTVEDGDTCALWKMVPHVHCRRWCHMCTEEGADTCPLVYPPGVCLEHSWLCMNCIYQSASTYVVNQSLLLPRWCVHPCLWMSPWYLPTAHTALKEDGVQLHSNWKIGSRLLASVVRNCVTLLLCALVNCRNLWVCVCWKTIRASSARINLLIIE